MASIGSWNCSNASLDNGCYSYGSIRGFPVRRVLLRLSDSRSRSPNRTQEKESSSADHQDTRDGAAFTSIETFVTFLQSAEIPGHMILVGDREDISSGSQFVVHKQRMV